jgi:hypothetical protein
MPALYIRVPLAWKFPSLRLQYGRLVRSCVGARLFPISIATEGRKKVMHLLKGLGASAGVRHFLIHESTIRPMEKNQKTLDEIMKLQRPLIDIVVE